MTILSKTLAAGAFALLATSVCAAPAKKPVKKADAVAAASEPEPDVKDSTATELACELGNTVTLYKNEGDVDHIALRWKKRLHRLTRVATTTGAQRFENTLYGLVWIGIPAKGILLDSKMNRQLANECKSPEQQQQDPH